MVPVPKQRSLFVWRKPGETVTKLGHGAAAAPPKPSPETHDAVERERGLVHWVAEACERIWAWVARRGRLPGRREGVLRVWKEVA